MSNEFVGYGADGGCRALHFGAAAPLKQPFVIAASVGIGGANRAADVSIIQRALNDVPPGQGRPFPALVVDGACGGKTKAAVQKFQLAHFGWSGADGRADPNGVTVAKLNELDGDEAVVSYQLSTGAMREPDPIVGAARVARVRGLVGQMQNCIRAAIVNATTALPAANATGEVPALLPSYQRAAVMTLLNRHFDIDAFPPKDRRNAVLKILKTFGTMESVFSRPGGLWGAAVFDYDRQQRDPQIYAYCAFQGYYRGGEKSWGAYGEIRNDTIYLCKRIDKSSDDAVIQTMLHELAHFVGHPEHITDHGYGWIDDARMKKLVPSQRMVNAESFCNYAFDAQFNRPPK